LFLPARPTLILPARCSDTGSNRLELVQDSLAESKMAHFSPFFTFFQLLSTGYAPSKTQKLTKNQPVFANGRES